MELKLGIGIDTIKFGMSELEVIALLGQPSVIKVDEDDIYQNTVYQYNDLKITLTFYSDEDFRLAFMRTTNPDVVYQGKPLIDQPLANVIDHFNFKKGEWLEEQFFTFSSHYFEPRWLILHEEYGRVTNVEIGTVRSEDTYKIVWPD